MDLRDPPAGDQPKIVEVNQPQRGDVMVFRYPADPSLDYIKRVVGLPGDRVEYIDKRLTIKRDAPAYVPQVLNFPGREHCTYVHAGVRCTVPAGHYFVLGDNRDASSDSRVWGFVPDQNIVGRAFFIWFNFGDMKRIGGFD
jgi:signal peptidase I